MFLRICGSFKWVKSLGQQHPQTLPILYVRKCADLRFPAHPPLHIAIAIAQII